MAETISGSITTGVVLAGTMVISSAQDGVITVGNQVEGQIVGGPQGPQGETGPQGDPGVVQSVVAGTNVTVDSTDPANPIVSANGDVASVNGQTGTVVLDADDIDDTSTTHKFVTASDLTTLSNTSGTNTGDQDLSGLVPKTTTVNGHALSSNVTVTKSDVGLGNVDNTSDVNKPISTATQAALDDKANDADVVKLTGSQTIAGAKTFDGGVVVDGDAGTLSSTAATGALKIEGSTNVNYVDIWGASANLFRATDTRSSHSSSGGGAAWGNNDGAALASGDRLGFNLFFGYDGATTRNGASFSAYAASGWASNNYPTYMVIDTAKSNSRIENIRMGGAGTAGVTINETGADQDFRIEGDTDQNLVFTDASTDRVGIGNNAPTEKLDVTGNIAVSGTVDGRDIAADGSKLDGIEASADVTDATNVAAAGAVMETDTSTADMDFVVDEDDMTSNSATKVPTQQSVKAYVDTQVGGVDHGGLVGLSDDDHTQYALLAGRSGGQTLSGSSVEDEHLTLKANAAAFNTSSNTGRIKFIDQVQNDGGFTISHNNGVPFKEWYYYAHRHTGTITLQSGANLGTYATVLNDATFVWDTGQIFSSIQLFDARPALEPTISSNTTDNTTNYRMFFGLPRLNPNISTASTWTGANFGVYLASPQVGIKTGSHASAAVVMPRMYSFASTAVAVGAQTTVTDLTHVFIQNAANTGTITRQIGVEIEALTGGTTDIGIRIAKADTYSLQLSDTGGTAAGGITFGTDTNIYRSAANTLTTDDDLAINSTTKGVIMSDRSNGKKYRLYMDNGFLSQEEVA